MNFLKKLGNTFSNIKTRSLLVVLAVIILVVSILVWTGLREKQAQVLDEGTRTKRIRPVESLPGAGTPSVIYDPLQEEENRRRAEQALQSGQSQVARLLNRPPEGYGRGSFGFEGDYRCEEECYDETGYDLSGLDREGFDRDGFDRHGYDAEGFDRDGFDRQGYDREGYDKDGYDRFGYDRDGFDRNGCNRQGYDRDGNLCAETLFGPDCFNQLGLDYNGCDRDGLNPEGEVCYDADGYNEEGIDKCGLDRSGYDKDGYNRYGCNAEGFDRDGNSCFDEDGYGPDGFARDGYDRNGCDRNGLNRLGESCYDALGYSEEGYDRQGYDKDGYARDGFDRNGYDQDGYNRDGYDRQGLDKDGYDRDGFDRNGCNREGLDRQGNPCMAGVAPDDDFANLLRGGTAPLDTSRAAAAEYERLAAERARLDAERLAELNAQQRAAALAEQQARLEAKQAMMGAQAQAILGVWAPPTQTYVQGQPLQKEEVIPAGGEGSGSGLPGAGKGPIIHKAGDIVFAVVETSINSDQPGPVLAKIVSGPLAGSKVLGSFQRQEKMLYVQFNLLSVPDLPSTIGMDAVAVDPETARTAVRTGVNNRYLIRYGTLIASAFLEGMGDAVLTSLGTPNLTDESGTIIASQVTASGRDQLIVGLGKAGQRIGQELDKSDIPPLVTLDSGTGVGLLFLKDLRIEEPEEPIVSDDTAMSPMPTPVSNPYADNSGRSGSGSRNGNGSRGGNGGSTPADDGVATSPQGG